MKGEVGAEQSGSREVDLPRDTWGDRRGLCTNEGRGGRSSSRGGGNCPGAHGERERERKREREREKETGLVPF